MRDIVLSLLNDLRTLAQQGTRRFGELYEMVHRREASKPNALWQADHAQLDILLLKEDGSAGRPWLTAVMILIGMSGIEKRIARFPQLYSRIGFVHEFRPLGAAEVQELLERCWTPPGVTLPDSGFTPEVVARLVRMTGGNLRLLTRLLTQVERVLGVNNTEVISVEIVEAARDSLVIGQA